jgi:hypothetical protein
MEYLLSLIFLQLDKKNIDLPRTNYTNSATGPPKPVDRTTDAHSGLSSTTPPPKKNMENERNEVVDDRKHKVNERIW